jgi:hypothetical protein
MGSDKTTILNLRGQLKNTIQNGTEPLDLCKILKLPTVLVIEGEGFTAMINICSPTDICLINLKIREEI